MAEVKPEPGPSEFNSNIPSSAPVGHKGLVSACFTLLKMIKTLKDICLWGAISLAIYCTNSWAEIF